MHDPSPCKRTVLFGYPVEGYLQPCPYDKFSALLHRLCVDKLARCSVHIYRWLSPSVNIVVTSWWPRVRNFARCLLAKHPYWLYSRNSNFVFWVESTYRSTLKLCHSLWLCLALSGPLNRELVTHKEREVSVRWEHAFLPLTMAVEIQSG
jgi:hypothetical protein